MKILVDREKCRGSGECEKICPQDAIAIVNGVAVIDAAKCDFDGICIPACPHGAISFLEEEKDAGGV
ncbi:MAG: 4Fe-4S binding protein [Deltaproteobacteria bacterium]|nr:MAG: 4Fe-4S binding protein [Deltaproteobacteria bacterium]